MENLCVQKTSACHLIKITNLEFFATVLALRKVVKKAKIRQLKSIDIAINCIIIIVVVIKNSNEKMNLYIKWYLNDDH